MNIYFKIHYFKPTGKSDNLIFITETANIEHPVIKKKKVGKMSLEKVIKHYWQIF